MKCGSMLESTRAFVMKCGSVLVTLCLSLCTEDGPIPQRGLPGGDLAADFLVRLLRLPLTRRLAATTLALRPLHGSRASGRSRGPASFGDGVRPPPPGPVTFPARRGAVDVLGLVYGNGSSNPPPSEARLVAAEAKREKRNDRSVDRSKRKKETTH